MDAIVGRKEEIKVLKQALTSPGADLIAIYGRRRVGKTYLIKSVYKDRMLFEFSGVHHADLRTQLRQFAASLQKAYGSPLPIVTPKDWFDAFDLLRNFLKAQLKNKKMVIFFDELPWIDTPRSKFLKAFGHFWNSWAAWESSLIVVICGSAASWMIKKILRDRGGLHNRVTKRIRLLPFTLAETEEYLKTRRVKLDHYQLLQVYMCMGGIPHYLKSIEPGMSAAQIINKACFAKNGLLHDEFLPLYQSLFEHAETHLQVVRTLAEKSIGMNRESLLDATGLTSGGGITDVINELEESGFISGYIPFGKKRKDIMYKLTDEFSLFYLRFVENNRSHGNGTWLKMMQGGSWKAWSGYAFENICMKHKEQLQKALGIADVYTEVSPWQFKGTKDEPGAQIDLLFDRFDHCINICEMKYSLDTYVINKEYAEQLRRKLQVFRQHSKSHKTLFLTFITPFGLKMNDYSIELVHKDVTMEALFT